MFQRLHGDTEYVVMLHRQLVETEYVVMLLCFIDSLWKQSMLLRCHVSGTSWGHRICCCVVMFQGHLGDTEYVVVLSCFRDSLGTQSTWLLSSRLSCLLSMRWDTMLVSYTWHICPCHDKTFNTSWHSLPSKKCTSRKADGTSQLITHPTKPQCIAIDT